MYHLSDGLPAMNDQHVSSLDQAAIDLVAALGGKWRGDKAMCHCPAHDDRTPSLEISVGERAVLYWCYAGCSQAAIGDAIKSLAGKPLSASRSVATQPRKPKDFSGLARKIWERALPLQGSLGEIYLQARKIDLLIPELRFDPACISGVGAARSRHPAIIAAVRDQNGLLAIHRTFLRADGRAKADIEEPKAFLGLPGGGLGRWGPEPRDVLRLAEGNEDAASAMMIATGGQAVWPVYGIRRYGAIEIAHNIRHIIIYTQPGIEAEKAIAAATPHLTANGRTLECVRPFGEGDWNDLLRAIR